MESYRRMDERRDGGLDGGRYPGGGPASRRDQQPVQKNSSALLRSEILTTKANRC